MKARRMKMTIPPHDVTRIVSFPMSTMRNTRIATATPRYNTLQREANTAFVDGTFG